MAPRLIAYAELPGLAGQELGVSDWLTITQERVDQFADTTGDDQWIHVDVERAKREIGGTIAHGYMILALTPFLARKIMDFSDMRSGLNYGVNKARFIQPVPVGAHIRLRLRITRVEERGDSRLVVSENIIEMEGSDQPVCVAETLALIYPG